MKSETFHNIASGINAIFVSVALCISGYWAYHTFDVLGEKEKAEAELREIQKRTNKWCQSTFTAYILGICALTPLTYIEPMAANVPENWILGVSPEGAGVIGMVINFLMATAIARNTEAPPW